jgi:hypothetical protein
MYDNVHSLRYISYTRGVVVQWLALLLRILATRRLTIRTEVIRVLTQYLESLH